MASSQLSGEAGRDKIEEFIPRFKSALSRCVQKGFLVEDCFTLIWEETLEEIHLGNWCRMTLYQELLNWARQQLDTSPGR